MEAIGTWGTDGDLVFNVDRVSVEVMEIFWKQMVVMVLQLYGCT